MQKIVAEGRMAGSKESYRKKMKNDYMSIEETIARIKFKRTIRRMIKLINSK